MSSQPVRDYLYSGATTKLIAHTMTWFDGHTHTVNPGRNPGYLSNDSEAVSAQCEYLRNCGVDVLMYNWYGPRSFENQSTLVYFEHSQLGHIINIDGNAFHSEGELRECIAYIRATYFTHPRYERWRDKYIITFFAKSHNDPQWFRPIETENPDCVFVYNGTQWGISQMAWIQSDLEKNVDWFCRTFGDKTDGLYIPCVFPGFNDDNGNGESCWHPGQPARIWPSGAPGPGGNWTTLEACFETVNRYYSEQHQLEYLQLVTMNDWDEGTQMERKFLIPAAAARRVALWANGEQIADAIAVPDDAKLLTVVELNDEGNVISAGNIPLA